MTEITEYDYSIDLNKLDFQSLIPIDSKQNINSVINSYYNNISNSNLDENRQIVETAELLNSEETNEILEAKEKLKDQEEIQKQKDIFNLKLSKITITKEDEKDEKIAIFTKNIRDIMPFISGTQRSKVMFHLFYSKYFSVNIYKVDSSKNTEKNKNIIKMKPEILKLQTIDLLVNSVQEEITDEQNDIYSFIPFL